MKGNNYYVIGGQYQAFNHGGAATLTGAKRLAAKCEELWDNWQGFHVPEIYAAEDCVRAKNFYGEQMIPKIGATPVAVWDDSEGRWQNA